MCIVDIVALKTHNEGDGQQCEGEYNGGGSGRYGPGNG